ncbi:synaptotagmin-6 isoform X2 [Fukomys damarensis]|uniref:synaptotagmin-6 isoform X2 n=1 Tax=Fukomys damarensis TaxID=885580 RepID=UPI0014550E0C|nr:synaptotagmin-6 isoform X2 [Fukomys damarensis]
MGLSLVTALIEIQTASKYERFTNLHVSLGCHLNYFPFPAHMPVGSRGGSKVLLKLVAVAGTVILEKSAWGKQKATGILRNVQLRVISKSHCSPSDLAVFLMTTLFSSSVFVPSVCTLCQHLCLLPPASVCFCPCPSGTRWAGTSVGLLAVVVIVCGVALVAVFLFLFWKLCWTPWRNKEASSPSSANPHLEAFQSPSSRGNMADKLKDPSTLGFLEAAVKISHTSPDIPAEVQMSVKEHIMRHTRLQRQTTEPASSTRHTSFKRHLPRQMHVSSVDYGNELPPAAEQPTSIGRIKPELYKQKSVDGDDAKSEAAKSCGKINFSLRYDYESETLIVRILKAFDLPAKDFCGSSDPYVKIYLLPDRKCKLQTRVHRKTLNPTFDENFHFPVPYEELADRKLHLSVFDFDRFSRHDMIGEVILDNLFEASDLSRETSIWKDIQYATSESVDLGEIMFSLCYLPTAGRLTLTVIKCRNLKAMDITGYSDPYVKVSLLCDGRRLKKKKTTIKKNTLNPVYNEAIIFDIPPENMDQVSLLISVMDYDRVGHNEIIGVCRVGINAEGLGRDHWNEMLAYPRKPIAHWHSLVEWQGRAASFDSESSCPSPKPPPTP